MAAKRRVTIKQVAEEAGVSAQTVSRVINKRADVAAATRQRILEIIDRLGYQPSNVVRSLIQGCSCTLGLVGYDDVPEAAFSCPPLTTIRQDLHELGRCAVREMGRLIDGDAQEGGMEVQLTAVLLQPELIVRESTTKRVPR